MSDLFALALAKPYTYRPLRLSSGAIGLQVGPDVYALQTALGITADGWFGPQTNEALRRLQRRSPRLVEDGVAGILTMRVLATRMARKARKDRGLPRGMLLGHLESESSYQFGIHTPPYTDGSQDCGVLQRNTNWTAPRDGFNVPQSIEVLAAQVRDKFTRYRSQGVHRRRAWELAAGSWNAPAWTDTLARGGTLSEAQSAWIEAYIDRVCRYLPWRR